MFPFFIDVYSSIENLTPSKKDVANTSHNAISDIAYSFYLELKAKALKLKNASQILFKDSQKGNITVEVKSSKSFKEEGYASFDLKPGLLASSKAKTSSSGSRYIVVPIGKKSPRQPVSQVQPQSAQYNPTNVSGISNTQIGTVNVSSSEITPTAITERPSTVAMAVRNIPAQVQEDNDEDYQKPVDVTLRIVSQNSDPRSWIHPGVKPNPLNPESLFNSFRPDAKLEQTLQSRFIALFR